MATNWESVFIEFWSCWSWFVPGFQFPWNNSETLNLFKSFHTSFSFFFTVSKTKKQSSALHTFSPHRRLCLLLLFLGYVLLCFIAILDIFCLANQLVTTTSTLFSPVNQETVPGLCPIYVVIAFMTTNSVSVLIFFMSCERVCAVYAPFWYKDKITIKIMIIVGSGKIIHIYCNKFDYNIFPVYKPQFLYTNCWKKVIMQPLKTLKLFFLQVATKLTVWMLSTTLCNTCVNSSSQRFHEFSSILKGEFSHSKVQK